VGNLPTFGPKGAWSATSKPNLLHNNMALDSTGNVYMFFGQSQPATLTQFNAVWKFDPTRADKYWMYVAGSSAQNVAAVRGTLGQYASANMPASRIYSAVAFDGNVFWAFGGEEQGVYLAVSNTTPPFCCHA